MKRYLYLLLFIAAMGAGRTLCAQSYPVQSGLFLQPPFSVYLSDYAQPGSQRLSLQLLLKDFNQAELPVRLRLKISNNQGIEISTRAGYLPAPLMLEGGIPLRLSGAEFAGYFAAENLDFKGISRSAFVQGGQALPEGLYNVCVEVYEYYQGAKVSNQACAMAWMILNDPPLLNLPANNEKPRAQEPQNLVFQWTPRHTGSPNAAFSTEYEFSLVEIWPANRNPNDAMLSTPPIYKATTRSSMLVYGPAETPLIAGRKYAWRVQAKSIVGVEEMSLFKNGGYSEVYTFQWGDECLLPTNVMAEAMTNGRIKLEWESQHNHSAFSVRYREKSDSPGRWYEKESYKNELILTELKHSTAYEYQVSGMCGSVAGENTAIASITTRDYEEPAFACGLPLEAINLDNVNLLASLQPGDIVQAGDFKVQISSVSGSGGTFKGQGLAVIPMMNKAKVNITFDNIQVDENYRMVGGCMNLTGAKLEVVPQEMLDMMDKLDETLSKVDGVLADIDKGLELSQEILNELGGLANEILDNGPFTKEEEEAYANASVAEYKSIAKEKVSAATAQLATASTPEEYAAAARNVAQALALKQRADKLQDIYSNADTVNVIAIAFTGATNWGFDAQAHAAHRLHYNILVTPDNQSHGVPWISTAAGQRNTASARFVENGSVAAENIIFKSGEEELTASRTGEGWTIQLPEVAAGSMKSVLALDKTSNKVVGRLDLQGYNKLERKVNIVAVNGANLNLTAAQIQTELNRIYGQAVAEWQVQELAGLTVAGFSGTLQDDEQALLSTYSTGMKDIINAFQSRGDYNKDEFYLFIVANSQTGKSGYMPRKHRYGFIYAGGGGNKAQTIAHELGHGAFRLQHTFEEYPTIAEQTQNLMDYGGGTVLRKYQWDMIHNPPVVVGLVEDIEEGAYKAWAFLDGDIISNIPGYENQEKSFLSPTGEIQTLPANARDFTFRNGYLIGFTLEDERYVALRNSQDDIIFAGYFYNAVANGDLFDTNGLSPYQFTRSENSNLIFFAIKDGECGQYSVTKAAYIPKIGAVVDGGIGKDGILFDFKINELTDKLKDYISLPQVTERTNCLDGRAKEFFKFVQEHYASNGKQLTAQEENELIDELNKYTFVHIKDLDGEMAQTADIINNIRFREMLNYGAVELIANLRDKAKDIPEGKSAGLIVELEDFKRIQDLYVLYDISKKLDSDCTLAEHLQAEIERQYQENGEVKFDLPFFTAVYKTSYELPSNEIFELLSCVLKNIKAPEALYNPNRFDNQSSKFVTSLFESFLQIQEGSMLSGMAEFQQEQLNYEFACSCGMWNSVVDVFLGLSDFGAGFTQNPVELSNKLGEFWKSVSTAEGWKMMGPAVWGMVTDHHGYVNGYGFDQYQATYGACYDVVFVASFFIGVGEVRAMAQAGKFGDAGEMARIFINAAKNYPKNTATSIEQLVKGIDKLRHISHKKLILDIVTKLPDQILVKMPEEGKFLIWSLAMDAEIARFSDEGLRTISSISRTAAEGKVIYKSADTFTDLESGKGGYLTLYEDSQGRVFGVVEGVDEWFARLPQALKDDIGEISSELGQYIRRTGQEGVENWKALSSFSDLRKIPANLEVLEKVKGKFNYDGKVGQEALEEIFSGHKSAQKFIENLKKADELLGAVEDVKLSGIKSNNEVRLLFNSNQIGKIAEGKLRPEVWEWAENYKKKVNIVYQTTEGYRVVEFGGNLAFDIGFKEGRVISGDEVNDFFKKGRGANEPYMPETDVIEVVLKPGDKLYVVEDINSNVPNPGAWGSKDKITTIKELREDIAVLQNWKDETKILDDGSKNELVVREYVLKKEIKVRSGIVGPQDEIGGVNVGKKYPGGAHQYEFIESLRGTDWKNYFDDTNVLQTVLK